MKWLRRINSVFLKRSYLRFKSLYRLGYIVNLNNPETFNEKINYRKLHWDTDLFVTCSDKIKVREYVQDRIGNEYLIPATVLGKKVTVKQVDEVLNTYSNGVLKANHNSGPVQFLSKVDPINKKKKAITAINEQLKDTYGYRNLETWYYDIKPEALIEKNLSDGSNSVDDYKFHVFNQKKGSKLIVQVDYDRFIQHGRALFDEDFQRYSFSLQYPDSGKKIDKPDNFGTMKEIAKILAESFSYCRVDLYNVKGFVYFGELTFANDGGFGRFSDKKYDKLMGMYWKGDPAF